MTEHDLDLIQRFVATFQVLDVLQVSSRELNEDDRGGDISPPLLPPAEPEGWREWRPVAEDVPRDALRELQEHIPWPLPYLYERLVLSYRWAEVDIGRLRLFANLPPALKSLTAEIARDSILFGILTPAGFVQFGKGPDNDYDPVCFDLRNRRSDDDARIVKFDHEEIFGRRRLVEVEELAPSFRRLMELVIEDARDKPSRRNA